MYSKWTSHLSDPEEKERFKSQIIGSRSVLDRQTQLIDEDEANLDKIEYSVKQFELPNWEVRTAYYFGYRAALNNLRKLNNLDQQDIPNDRKLTQYPTPIKR